MKILSNLRKFSLASLMAFCVFGTPVIAQAQSSDWEINAGCHHHHHHHDQDCNDDSSSSSVNIFPRGPTEVIAKVPINFFNFDRRLT